MVTKGCLVSAMRSRPGRRADLGGERARGRRCPVRRRRLGTGDRVEQGGAVAHAARDRVRDGEAAPELRAVGPDGRSPARRLDPEQAATGGGDADRPAAVVGVRHRDDAGGDRRARAAAGAARGHLRVPRVARGTEQLRFAEWEDAELGQVRLAEDDGARAAEAFDERGVAGRFEVRQEPAAGGVRHARDGGVEILEQQGHAAKRGIRRRQRGGVAPGLLVHPGDDGVDARIDALGARDRFLQQLGGRHLAAMDELREPQRVEPAVFGDRHRQLRRSIRGRMTAAAMAATAVAPRTTTSAP